MSVPWLVTWSTRGTWLPGDARGFRTRRGKEYVPPPARYAKHGEAIYDPGAYRERYAAARHACADIVVLTLAEQQLAMEAIVHKLDELPLTPYIIAVGKTHIHVIAAFGQLWIRPTVGLLKAEATRHIPNPGTRSSLWTEQCHMESLPAEADFQGGLLYVRGHVEEGALIYEW
jgi:hypothetical protein